VDLCLTQARVPVVADPAAAGATLPERAGKVFTTIWAFKARVTHPNHWTMFKAIWTRCSIRTTSLTVSSYCDSWALAPPTGLMTMPRVWFPLRLTTVRVWIAKEKVQQRAPKLIPKISNKLRRQAMINFQIWKRSKRKNCWKSSLLKSRRKLRSVKRYWKTKRKLGKKKRQSKGTKKSEANLASVRSMSITRCSADESKSNATNQTRHKIKPVCCLMLCTAAVGEAERKTVCLNWPNLRRKYVKRSGVTLKTAWSALMSWVVEICPSECKSRGRSARKLSMRNRISASTRLQPAVLQTIRVWDKGKLHFFWKMKSRIVGRKQEKKAAQRWTIQKSASLSSDRKKSSWLRSVLKKRLSMRKVWESSRH